MLEFQQGGNDTLNLNSAMPITYAKADVYATDKDGHIVYQRDGDVYRWDWRRETCRFQLQDNAVPDACDKCCPWLVELYHDSEGKNRLTHMRVEWDERSDTRGIQVEWKRQDFGQEEVLATMEVVSSVGFGLPREVSSNSYSATLTGCGIMHEVKFATSRAELAERIEDV